MFCVVAASETHTLRFDTCLPEVGGHVESDDGYD